MLYTVLFYFAIIVLPITGGTILINKNKAMGGKTSLERVVGLILIMIGVVALLFPLIALVGSFSGLQ
jgi:uncharacterized membrane protein HdeD (DUF308 family)